jgi:PAS domain S-box-containing protein
MFQMTQNQGLPESTDWYRLLGDNLPYYALLLFDRNLGYRLAQGSFLAAHGYEAAKILGQPVSAVPIFAGEVPNLPELCRLALQGQPHCVSWLADSVAYNLQILPVRDEQGEIGGGMLLLQDVTEQKRAEEKFRLLVEFSPDAMVVMDKNGRIAQVNAQTERLFGYSRQEMVGQPLEMLMPPRFRQGHANFVAGYLRHPRLRKLGSGHELYGYHKDGTEFILDISLSPIEGEDGLVVVSVLRDITDQRQAERQMQATNELLEQRVRERTAELQARNSELDAFAHTVAHDLKNPLTILMGTADMLHRHHRQFSPEEVETYLAVLVRDSQRMNQIINELLILSSVSHSQSPPLQAVDMSQPVTEALHGLSQMIAATNAEIIQPETWPEALGHAPWLHTVWFNYLSNALKYGGNPPRLELGFEPLPGQTIKFWVRDNGPGLSAAQQSRLFTPFTRLGNRQVEGTGVGLSIVQRIIDRLGGQVGVESQPGQGSCFYFTLPGSEAR